jgi:iron complex transport system ATP-binding protein
VSLSPALELVAVSARYPATGASQPDPPLEGVTLTVMPGEILAVVGANGAGKSTLLRVMAGTLAPERGEARVSGDLLASLPRQEVARRIAVVAQSEEVRFSFSVREVVAMGRAPHQGVRMAASAEDRAIVEGALERCDLQALAERPVDALSGGERKRVAIARALAQRTPIVLLDEPTASLDVRHQVALLELLVEEAGQGKACVLVTHDLQLAAAHATRAALMHRGTLMASGPTSDVLSATTLTEAFEWPIHAGRFDGTGARVFVAGGTKP